MKVKELKELLEGLPDDRDIIMSSDPEGNSYLPLGGFDEGYVDARESYYVDNYYSESHSWKDNCFESKKEWEEYTKNNRKVLVLFPG